MKSPKHRLIIPALLAAAIPTMALAQTQTQQPQQEPSAKGDRADRGQRLSPEARAKLLDGRMAMIKETLKLNDAQLKLWAPVETQMRASADSRQKVRADRMATREQGAARPSMADRVDRASQLMTQRAERMKAFSEAFRPFYASLSDEQKALAGVVLRQGGRGSHHHHGHAMRG